jgi:proliferating cell nuclear antigen
MDIDSDHLGIPEQEFDAVVKMSSVEFQKICRDMAVLADTGLRVATENIMQHTHACGQ